MVKNRGYREEPHLDAKVREPRTREPIDGRAPRRAPACTRARSAVRTAVLAAALLPANVDSVTLGGNELMLNLAGIGNVPLSQVQVIGQ